MADSAEDRAILCTNLWGDDDSDYRVLDNRMVITRVRATCAICFGAIAPGVRVRASREVYDGICKTFRVCPACCRAILRDARGGDGLHFCRRFDLGRTRGGRP